MSENGEAQQLEDKAAREASEAAQISLRILQLHVSPIKGKFDVRHQQAIHAHIFQNFPEHQPGIIRSDTSHSWIKGRILEGRSNSHRVCYANKKVAAKIKSILKDFGGPQAIEGLPLAISARQLAGLYGDLDHAHGFYEGNSRTLREFTRELAAEAGFRLDWARIGLDATARNRLYIARDLAVMERAFPGLTAESAMQTTSRAEYEASFVVESLRREANGDNLTAIFEMALHANCPD